MEVTGSAYRMTAIFGHQKFLAEEKKRRQELYESYSKANKAFYVADTIMTVSMLALSGSGAASLAAVGLIPVGVALASLTAVVGAFKVLGSLGSKRCGSKIKKHAAIEALATEKLNQVEDLVSKALVDNEISEDEFSEILTVVSSYHEQKKKTQMKYSLFGGSSSSLTKPL